MFVCINVVTIILDNAGLLEFSLISKPTTCNNFDICTKCDLCFDFWTMSEALIYSMTSLYFP